MPEMFAGPWDLRFTVMDRARANRLVIEGTDSADGIYEKAPDQELNLTLTGGMWSVEVQSRHGHDGEWVAPDVRRIIRVDPTEGIVVRLRTSRPIEGLEADPASNAIDLVYRDPNMNPPPPANPFDFTYGGHD